MYFYHTESGSSGSNTGPAIGAAVGGIMCVMLTVLLFAALYYYCWRHKKYKIEKKTSGNCYILYI